jgi:hypothetical protein
MSPEHSSMVRNGSSSLFSTASAQPTIRSCSSSDCSGVVIDEWEQARALTALIEAAAQREWIAGVFIWRYYANLDDVSQEAEWGFSPHGKLAERAFEAIYGQRWAADPPPFTY